MIMIQQYQYQSPGGPGCYGTLLFWKPENCSDDSQVSPGGPGSYGTLLFRKLENRSNDSGLQLALDRQHAQEAGIKAAPVACLRLFGENNLLAVFKSFPA